MNLIVDKLKSASSNNGTKSIEASVQFDKVELLYSSTRTAFGIILLTTGSLYYLFAPILDNWEITAWAIYMPIVAVARLILNYFYNAAGDGKSNPVWYQLYKLTSLLTGLGWGFAAYAFLPDLNYDNQLILTIVILGYMSGAMTTQFPSALTFATLFYPGMLALIYRSFQADVSTANAQGFLLILFTIFLTGAARRLRNLMTTALELRYQHQELTENYRIKNEVSLQLNDSLESEIRVHKETHKKMLAAVSESEAANLAKSEFLSTMSHELRTPMNAILGFAQLLEFGSEKALTKEQRNCIEHIMQGGNHLLKLINQVLDLAKIESGKMEVSLEEIRYRELCEECLGLIERQALESGLSVNTDLQTSQNIKADYTGFKQVVLNLLSNAIKYNREHGSITLSSRATTNNRVRISITDTGKGIPEELQTELFEPFNRLGREGGAVEGTGIGLTICRQLTELMGGEIGFDSKPGTGSTFWIEFPGFEGSASEPNSRDESPVEDKNPAPNSIRAKILCVEDNQANMMLVEKIISSMDGLELISAHDAELGLSIAETLLPDLILMDINLPGMDGFEAVKQLREKAATKNIPVVAITAAAMRHDIEKGMAAGFNAYLTKPINIPEFIETVEKTLSDVKTPG